jgi:hypothetical protein
MYENLTLKSELFAANNIPSWPKIDIMLYKSEILTREMLSIVCSHLKCFTNYPKILPPRHDN